MSLDILSAMIFSIVLIHFAFIPTSEPIKRPRKNLARARPIADFLLICKVQFNALVLSVTHRTTGWGLSLIFFARQGGECCAIVYYDCDVFEAIDGYEILVQIVLEMEKSPLNNVFWKIKVPPKF